MTNTAEGTQPEPINHEPITQAINALGSYHRYFTETDQANQLVEWVYRETGFSKGIVRAAVKRIALFVLAGQIKESEQQAEAAAGLFAKLPHYHAYLWFAHALLDVLNAKADTNTALDKVLQVPTVQDLAALDETQTHWGRLSPETQGLAQLLMVQSREVASQQQLQQQFIEVMKHLHAIPELETTEHRRARCAGVVPGSMLWLNHAGQQTQCLGRSDFIQQLATFFYKQPTFSWWVITGAGGVGKRRVVFETLQQLPFVWCSGFLLKQQFNADTDWSQWRPGNPTVIVIEGAEEHPQAIANMIDQLHSNQGVYNFPVRLLLLARQAEGQSWWKSLVGTIPGSQLRKQCLYKGTSHTILPLNQFGQKQLLKNLLQVLGSNSELPASDHPFWSHLNVISVGKPLLVGMVAIAIEQQGFDVVGDYSQEDLLQYLLENEKRRWAPQLGEVANSDQAMQKFYHFIMINHIAREVFTDPTKIERQSALLLATQIGSSDKVLGYYWKKAAEIRFNEIEADIFTEFFACVQWRQTTDSGALTIKHYRTAAYLLHPVNTRAFIVQMAVDFPADTGALHWVDELLAFVADNTMRSEMAHIHQAVFDVVGQLYLHGEYNVALDWLKRVTTVEDQHLRARALNQCGMQNQHLGNTDTALAVYQQSLALYRESSDKLSEVQVLSNIAHLFESCKDYANAMDYRQQLYALHQEIGDKTGEATALDMMAGIAHICGDYDTALNHLEHALNLKQAVGDKRSIDNTTKGILRLLRAQGGHDAVLKYLNQQLESKRASGDKAGESDVLTYLSHAHKAHSNNGTALDYMKQVLSIKQAIGDKVGEGIVLNEIATAEHALGSHHRALDYLRQAWVIKRETGDKAGEGTVLNNLSQIHDALGDRATALKYLQQSLKLQGQVGDWSGMCPTLFNIGLNYWQDNEQQKAMANWLEMYGIATNIHQTQAIQTLEKLSNQLGLKGGLAKWEELWKAKVENIMDKPPE